MQLKSLQLLIDVAETGSFVAAANLRHTVQSNVTAHVKKLENELGVQLFHRKGGIQLTAAGRSVVTYAKQMLQIHDDVLSLFHDQKSMPGKLYLGAMESTTAVRLPEILAAFHREHPEVELIFETGTSTEMMTKLLEGELDGAFIAGCPDYKNFHFKRAFRERLVLVGPKSLAQLPDPIQLAKTTFLVFRQGCSYRQRMELFLSSSGVTTSKVFEFGSIDGILGCVAAGMGYTLMPLSCVEAYSHRFDIDYFELPPSIADVDTYFATADPKTWSPALAQFSAILDRAELLDR